INLIKEGEITATGQELKYSVSSHETFEDVLMESDYDRKIKEYSANNKPILEKLKKGKYPKTNVGDVLKGVGITAFLHGAGFTGTGENRIKGKLKVKIDKMGRPEIFAANTEMGQGKDTAFRKMMADALYIDIADVVLAPVNTDLVPDSGPTVASRSTMIVGSLIVDAAEELILQLSKKLQNSYGESFVYKNGHFYGNGQIISFKDAALKFPAITINKHYEHPSIIKFDEETYKGDAYPVYSWAAAVADIEVDPVTFEIRVKKYFTTHDIGKAINYDQSIAQIQGGSLQGIGYAIYENIKLQNGQYDVTGFSDYIIPTPTEMPEFKIKIMENPYPFGPFGAKGLGELPLGGPPPAIASA
ncbi:MAG: molybdopterin-dependent oxidoreductase, partial [Calditrichia bacterium]|nr:molybdopterin-dependent oxidoreductase [Calditrichia bacterium]